jgi:hypothetical protein
VAQTERALPHNLEAERSVLGAVLIRNEAFDYAVKIVAPGDFFRDAHRRIFEKMIVLGERSEAIDLVTLKEALAQAGELDQVGGPAYIASLVDGVPHSTNVEHYARIVKEKSTLRALIHASTQIAQRAWEAEDDPNVILDDAQRTILSVAEDRARGSRESFTDTLPDVLARARETESPSWVVEGLIPDNGLTLIHSQPRELKSITTLQGGLHIATGTPAFGLERLQISMARPVLYVSDEDPWRRVAERLAQLCAGLGLTDPPPNFHSAVGKGINLDDPEWQERLIASVRAEGYVTILDPLRSLSSCTDQGPRELKPLALFLRRLLRETGCPVVMVHHDTKPGDKPDTRRRPQKASGGGIFSIADAPIAVEPLDEHSRLLVPTAFKFSADPPPVAVRLHSGPGWLRLEGAEHAAQNDHAVLDARILTFLSHSPYTYGSKVAAGVQAGKALVLARLKALAAVGAIDSLESDRGIKWFRSDRKAAA